MKFMIALAIAAQALAAQPEEIALTSPTPDHGVRVEQAFQGVSKQYIVRLPAFEVATYYAAFQRHDPLGRQNGLPAT
jgi:hypothetical protein